MLLTFQRRSGAPETLWLYALYSPLLTAIARHRVKERYDSGEDLIDNANPILRGLLIYTSLPCTMTRYYITLQIFKGGLSKNFKDHRAQHATQATI